MEGRVRSMLKRPSWMLLQLGFETQVHHATADADRLQLMEVRSLLEYRTALASILGFEAPLEAALAPLCAGSLVRDRARAHWLRRDLQALGMSVSTVDCLPHCTIRITSFTQALGWLFVTERHTLLAGLILRHLVHRFGDKVHGATGYLAAYGDAPGARFRALCEAIDDHSTHHPAYPALVTSAALEAFRCQRQWYLSSPSERESRSDGGGAHSRFDERAG